MPSLKYYTAPVLGKLNAGFWLIESERPNTVPRVAMSRISAFCDRIDQGKRTLCQVTNTTPSEHSLLQYVQVFLDMVAN